MLNAIRARQGLPPLPPGSRIGTPPPGPRSQAAPNTLNALRQQRGLPQTAELTTEDEGHPFVRAGKVKIMPSYAPYDQMLPPRVPELPATQPYNENNPIIPGRRMIEDPVFGPNGRDVREL
jgi:hypothetical protein